MGAITNQYKLKHKDNCLNKFTKVKRIYIRAYKVGKGQYFEHLGLICESCFSITLDESYCKKMNDKPAKELDKHDVEILISKGISRKSSYEDMMRLKNRLASDEELTVEKE